MTKLNELQASALDSDYKALVEANILNPDLTVHDTYFIHRFIIMKFKVELASIAKERLEQAKKETEIVARVEK